MSPSRTHSVSSINFLQINLRHSYDANVALQDYAESHLIDIIFCQDPHIIQGAISGLPGHWRSFTSSLNTAGIIIVNTAFYCVESLVSNNSILVNLTLKELTLNLLSQYSKPRGDLQGDFDDWTDSLQNKENLLVGGDFNAHLPSFGYSWSDDRGNIVQETVMLNDLIILNDFDSDPTFVSDSGDLTGRPDLTMAGLNIYEKISEWRVDNTVNSLSDHKIGRAHV